MNVAEPIRYADALLPGVPLEEGEDPRWQAIIAVSEFIESEPEAVWKFICRWGDHPQEDLRAAISSCLLEHLLEHHFDMYFPKVETIALAKPLFGDTFLRCWQFGEALLPENSLRFVLLKERLQYGD